MGASKPSSGKYSKPQASVQGSVAHRAHGEEFVPMVDIIESAKSFKILVELPGVPKRNIKAYITGEVVVVEGVKVPETLTTSKASQGGKRSGRINYLCLERYFGPFRTTVQVPTAINTQKIAASYENGVLAITLPKIQDRRGRKKMIKIE